MMEIIIPFKTPSVNHLYGSRGFRRYLKPEAKELKVKIAEIVQKAKKEGFILVNSNKLTVRVEIHENWYTKDGKVKKKDIANREKFLIDSIFDELGIDDKGIFKHTMIKKQSEKEFAVVTIT